MEAAATALMPKRALIVGGTHGIGNALARLLVRKGWIITATGRKEFDIGIPATWFAWREAIEEGPCFDLAAFCAGELRPGAWDAKTISDYEQSYAIHCSGPLVFLAYNVDLFAPRAKIIFLSSVGASNAGIVDLTYGCAKAALEKAARALAHHSDYQITLVKLDLVRTRMARALPRGTLRGRRMIEPDEAAKIIIKEAGL